MLNQAQTLDDLRILRKPPEALKGDRLEQYSIRINDRWRICIIGNKVTSMKLR
jgi:proteic killer suppression protein